MVLHCHIHGHTAHQKLFNLHFWRCVTEGLGHAVYDFWKGSDGLAYVTVPKDLDRIKNRVAFSLTLRQAVCLGIAGMVGVPAYFLTREGLGTSNASLAMVALMLPAFLFALYEKDGLPLEEVLMNIVKVKYLRPRERVFYRKAKPEPAKERQADAAIPDGNNGLEEEDAVEDYEVSFAQPDRRDGFLCSRGRGPCRTDRGGKLHRFRRDPERIRDDQKRWDSRRSKGRGQCRECYRAE